MSADSLTELDHLTSLLETYARLVEVYTACEAQAGGQRFPVHVITLGSNDPKAPCVGFFGGVHGLERIGSQIVVAGLESLLARLTWDRPLASMIETVRLVFMPIVNPAGMWRGTRANGSGVDLMRNAPVDAEQKVPFLAGGQRLSARLPWYRGVEGAPMQAESAALCKVVKDELLGRDFSIALDCHSGFGHQDRIWFPYACRVAPIEHLAEVHALKSIFDGSYRFHRYLFEPQSRQYLAHGDLWDYLYGDATGSGARVFLPLTLEMGSWSWVRKNPRQLFSRHGIFNPLIVHREQRVMRRHLAWMDFLVRAAASAPGWLPVGEERGRHREMAMRLWYA